MNSIWRQRAARRRGKTAHGNHWPTLRNLVWGPYSNRRDVQLGSCTKPTGSSRKSLRFNGEQPGYLSMPRSHDAQGVP